MKHIDEFSRSEEYISPFDRHFRRLLRETIEESIMPYRRQYDEDWKNHHLIEPAFDRIMAGLGLQKGLFPIEYGGMSLAKSCLLYTSDAADEFR
ncbi:MAG: acyl-CoA dehydrogenase family protein, partial [Bacteroidota bacterium]|nr:acyl-CoA dehydrogenase family protein [Bacteroidota bacterium]